MFGLATALPQILSSAPIGGHVVLRDPICKRFFFVQAILLRMLDNQDKKWVRCMTHPVALLMKRRNMPIKSLPLLICTFSV